MKYLILRWSWPLDIASKLCGFKVIGLTGIPFVIVVEPKASKATIRHEQVHQKQMWELFIVGFYFLYAYYYVRNRIVYKMSHTRAYRYNPLEVEAYRLEKYDSEC